MLAGRVKTTTLISTYNATTSTSVILPAGTVIDSVDYGVEYYRGTPYARSPTSSLRLKPPVSLASFDSSQPIGVGPACPQMTAVEITPLLLNVLVLPDFEQTLLFGTVLGDETEDCLTVSVMRPQGTAVDT